MKLIHLILAGLIFTAIFVFWVTLQPVSELSSGGAHPTIPAMSIGGDGADRSTQILLPAYLWQTAVLITASLMLMLGISRRHRTTEVKLWIGAGAAAMIAVWTALVLTYRGSFEAGETGYFLGFPVASSFMIYGIWIGQAAFTVFYVTRFHQYIFSAEDEARFQAVLEKKAKGDYVKGTE